MDRFEGKMRCRHLRLRRDTGTALVLTMIMLAGGAAYAQTPPAVTPFYDSLDPSSVSVLGTGGYTTRSNYGVNSITTTAEKIIGNQYNSTSHTWTSINDSYTPSGMTAPGGANGATNPLAAFGQTDYPITNSDGRTSSASGNGKDALLFTDTLDSDPSQTGGTIYGVKSVFLVSPLITVQNGSVIAFYTKGASDFSGAVGGDRLKLLFSSSSTANFDIGTFTPTGGTTGSTGGHATYTQGDFSKTLVDINPSYIADGTGSISTGTSTASGSYPTNWTRYNITMSGLTTSASNPFGATTGRFAFQYLVEHANPYANDGYGNDISIDDFGANLPEPGSIALLALSGLPTLGTISVRRRRRCMAQ